MSYLPRCPNMNHGRLNAPIRFCPNCGDKVNAQIPNKCDGSKHPSLRKDRQMFCHQCGEKLMK